MQFFHRIVFMSLFRAEVYQAKQNRWTGQIILTRPFSFTFLTMVSSKAPLPTCLHGSKQKSVSWNGQRRHTSRRYRITACAAASGRVNALNAEAGQQVDPALLNEPVYLVRVKPDKATINVYGKEQPLHIGMVVEADILHERKRLYK